MLMAHKLLDAMSREDSGYRFATSEDTPMDLIKNLGKGVAYAEKFDFGEMHFEPAPGGADGHYTLPDLTPVERGFWIDGLIPLPSEICWFEYQLGRSRSGLLITSGEEDEWTVQRLDWIKSKGFFWYDGIILGVHRKQQEPFGSRWRVHGGGSPDGIKRMNSAPSAIGKQADLGLSIYLTLMINSSSTEVSVECAPPKLNKARRKRGESPLFDHRIVRIVPSRYLRARTAEAGSGRVSPKLHWRRTHKRHLGQQAGRAVWAEKELHKQRLGWWLTIVPRHLVGRADLGEITHEYRVAL